MNHFVLGQGLAVSNEGKALWISGRISHLGERWVAFLVRFSGQGLDLRMLREAGSLGKKVTGLVRGGGEAEVYHPAQPSLGLAPDYHQLPLRGPWPPALPHFQLLSSWKQKSEQGVSQLKVLQKLCIAF